MYKQGNSRAVNTWIRDFACKIPGPSQNLTFFRLGFQHLPPGPADVNA